MSGLLSLIFAGLVSFAFGIPRLGCGPVAGASGNVRNLHRVAIMGSDHREILGDFVRRKRLSSNVFAAMGEINCLGFEMTAQLSGADNVLTTAAHVFFHPNCSLKPGRETCFFRPNNSTEHFELDLTSLVHGCRPGDFNGDWAVVKLKSSVPNVRPFEVPRSEVHLSANQRITMASHVAVNFSRNGVYPSHAQECLARAVNYQENPSVKTDCDTGGGASGSAWLVDGPRGFVLGGIHTGTGSNLGDGPEYDDIVHYNRGAPLIGEFFRALNQAIGR